MKTENRIEQIAGIAAAFFLVVGCFVVLRPFISALLWAAILCFSTWPFYSALERALQGRRTLAATLMTLLITLVLVAPFTVVGISLADNIRHMLHAARELFSEGLPSPPLWVGKLPIIGPSVETYWAEIAHNSDKLMVAVKDFMTRSRGWFLDRGLYIGQALFQLSLSVFIAFFFYRDGVTVVGKVNDAVERIVGDRTQYFLDVVGGTVKGVVYGVLGTALAQGILAGIGFWIGGVPAALFLGFLTFFMSLVPMGPPLIWIPATAWLIHSGFLGRGIFMGLWGLLVVSSVDNFLKPYLISRGSNLPFVLVFLGVLGGVLAFGFIGVFLGPTLLAVGYGLVKEWSSANQEDHA